MTLEEKVVCVLDWDCLLQNFSSCSEVDIFSLPCLIVLFWAFHKVMYFQKKQNINNWIWWFDGVWAECKFAVDFGGLLPQKHHLHPLFNWDVKGEGQVYSQEHLHISQLWCLLGYHNLYYININLHYNDNVAIGSYYPVPFAALVTSDEIWFVSKVELVFRY